jgi:hypothetical protein
MSEYEATRTLVKSPPELWLACSVQESLARHLQSFGEIRITRLEPESAVAWEGDATSGTVRIEPSGWGTRVTLTARSADAEPEPELLGQEPELLGQEPESQPEPAEQPPAVRGRVWQRLIARLRPGARAETAVVEHVAAEPVVEPEAPGEADPSAGCELDTVAALDAALASLGQAHHRPFSRG